MDASERQLVAAAQRGDRGAQAKLIGNYQVRIFRLAYHLVGNAHDAEDVAQEALFKALTNLAGFRGESGFGTWLYRITYREALAVRARRKPAADLDDLEMPGSSDLADEQLRGELGAAITNAVAELSPRQRECFRLKHFAELKISAIAEITGLDPGSVKQHLFRAVRHLQAKLTPYLKGGEPK